LPSIPLLLFSLTLHLTNDNDNQQNGAHHILHWTDGITPQSSLDRYETMIKLRERLKESAGWKVMVIRFGDEPTCTLLFNLVIVQDDQKATKC
jgi:hypothetical protein